MFNVIWFLMILGIFAAHVSCMPTYNSNQWMRIKIDLEQSQSIKATSILTIRGGTKPNRKPKRVAKIKADVKNNLLEKIPEV